MKKLIFILSLTLLVLTGCNNKETNTQTNNNINYSKLSSTNDTKNNENNSTDNEIENNENSIENNKNSIEINKTQEIEVNSYTSKVLDKSAARVNNLKIACGILNNYVVPAGETFSFNSVLGPSDKEKGYQKAKIFDSNGNVLEEYGGRNMPNK